jgi:uncharacterized protein
MNTIGPLQPPIFLPLPVETFKPRGWLYDQLRLQADGISGRLDEFWPDIQHSRWFGGDREGWERAPYWLDGLIPLAYLLQDPGLIEKVNRYLNHILINQHEDGWLGPKAMVQAGGKPEETNYDLWGQMLATKVLVQYYDATGDQRVITALTRAFQKIDRHIDGQPLFNWGQFRWFETLIAIFWLYEKMGDPWLLELAVKIQAQGFDWRSFFERWTITQPTPKGRWNFMGHVVNNAMAIKGPALWWRLTGDDADRVAVHEMLNKLDRYHGMVTGIFTGDECLAGTSPVQGTELCAVVEYMYSLEVLMSVLGDPTFADRLETIAFNALPATFSPDMWAHQYDQQANQVECSILENRTWNTNGPGSNIFGVDPNYGCCTANLSQGWPKFAAHLWMKTQDGGLAAMAYAPCNVQTRIQNAAVSITVDTDYPFRDDLHISVKPQSPVEFPLLLRIPTWAEGAVIIVNGERAITPQPGTFARLDRSWESETTITMQFPMMPVLHKRERGAIAVSRGPLVYSLKIDEDWRRVHEDLPYRELPHADWEVYPLSSWNYGLLLDENHLSQAISFHENPVSKLPFSPEGAPVNAVVQGRRLPEWGQKNGSALPVPPSPVESSEPLQPLTLIPYGCTNLRITEFPLLKG